MKLCFCQDCLFHSQKGSGKVKYYKQVCVYGFTPEVLQYFCKSKRGAIESIEEIELLRFIESRHIVKFVEVEVDLIAVDTINDLEKVKNIIKKTINIE